MLIMTPRLWRELQTVQDAINSRIHYRTDMDLYGLPDFWEIASREGDCEDYSLAKRAEFLKRGWPVDCLRLAVCLDETGAGHAVLTVDTDRGTYVLDNRSTFVEPWDKLPYTWIKRQAAGGTEWVTIEAEAQ